LRGEHAAGDQRRLARNRQPERLQEEQCEHHEERPLAVRVDETRDRRQRQS
jgi:hypothetical protein